MLSLLNAKRNKVSRVIRFLITTKKFNRFCQKFKNSWFYIIFILFFSVVKLLNSFTFDLP